MKAQGSAALDDEAWEACSEGDVALSFLRSEWDIWAEFTAQYDRQLIGSHADLQSPTENALRSEIVWRLRGLVLRFIPPDTKWYRVRYLRRAHFHQLRSINHIAWISPDDENELEKVALRAKEPCTEPADANWSPILWGHEKSGPFSILEGNHRMTALARSATPDGIALTTLIGLSNKPCVWHLPDRVAAAVPLRHSW